MKLHQIIKCKSELEADYSKIQKEYREATDKFQKEIAELERLEKAAMNDLNIDYIQLAESVMRVSGDPYGNTDGNSCSIAAAAINDIANGCKHLKRQYYGNKMYSAFYQRCDCEYGYGPSHGRIVDEIALKDDAQKRELTSDEKDACIYYLKNYKKIKELATVNSK